MEALRERLPYEVSARAFRALVDRLGRESDSCARKACSGSNRIGSSSAATRAGSASGSRRRCKSAGFHPPDLKQLAEELKLPAAELARMRTLLGALEREGRVVKIATDLYFSREAMEAARQRLLDHLKTDAEITAAAFRDLLGASRKFAIALLDYFDHSGVTTRVGDARRLRARP